MLPNSRDPFSLNFCWCFIEETRILPSLGPSNIIAKTGDRVIFHCSAVCDDELELSIYWKKNGQTINFDSSKKLFQGNDFSLMINDVDELDSGEYTCIARTRLDEASASATLKVEPKMNIPETTSVNREFKKWFVLLCSL